MKWMKRIATAFLALLVFAPALSACAKKESGFQLQYFNGMDLEKYDTSLLWRNTSEVVNDGGGDGDVLWVSEEEDPVNGGWFYLYSTFGGGYEYTEEGKKPSAVNGEAAYKAYVTVARSKDMVDWQPCGALPASYCLKAELDTWVQSNMYAPECIFDPKTEKYYLYITALSKVNTPQLQELGARYSNSTASAWDRFYIGVAVSETPYGPFEFVTSEKYYGDKNQANPNGYVLNTINPTILIDEECDELFYTEEFMRQFQKVDGTLDEEAFEEADERFVVIDVHPFFDENGDFYLYFARHMASNSPGGHNIWGFRMQDMVTPDYTTLTNIMRGSYTTGFEFLGNADATVGKKFVRTEYAYERELSQEVGKTKLDPLHPPHLAKNWLSYTRYADGTESTDGQNEAGLVEAPNMTTTKDKDGNTVYVMSYAPLGVDRVQGDYDMKAAYAYSPLGPFIKPNPDQGATILGTDASVNDFMSNLGHASFVTVGEETWIAHWQRQTPFGGVDQGRLYALSSCSFQYVESTGIYMPIANGPTTSLQAKTCIATGYKNVALGAKITATNVKDNSTAYLNDGMWVTRGVWADREFKANKSTEIRITFDAPTDIRGILIYNSYTTDNAFKNISTIRFDLAATPAWHKGAETSCYIRDLPYNVDGYMTGRGQLQPGSAAVATFNEIKVKAITVTVSESDLISKGELRISEIVVLGK